MSEMTMILQRLDKMQESIDGLRGELDVKLQENNKSLQTQMQENTDMLRAEMQENANTLRAEMQENTEMLRAEMHEMNENLRAELTQRMDNMEYGLGQEIQAVYELAQQNAENIRQLMPYKSRFANLCTMADRVERLEECQKVTTGVVASHSEAIRKLESRLA
ncbi:MAG: hypothetical protein NC548_11655 [Lachnospiraceae bacterium]|nr:hypothetical protein [Lachnospiraceae bacterium]